MQMRHAACKPFELCARSESAGDAIGETRVAGPLGLWAPRSLLVAGPKAAEAPAPVGFQGRILLRMEAQPQTLNPKP